MHFDLYCSLEPRSSELQPHIETSNRNNIIDGMNVSLLHSWLACMEEEKRLLGKMHVVGGKPGFERLVGESARGQA